MAKKVEEPVSDENVKPKKYDEEGARQKGENLAKQQAEDSRYEKVPDITQFPPDPVMEARAEIAKAEAEIQPKFEPEDGQPSPSEFIAKKAQLRQQRGPGDGITPREDVKVQVGVPEGRPFYPEPDANFAVDGVSLYLLVIEYGGKWRVLEFTSFDYLRGYVQNVPGTKRLFQKVQGQAEYQEIKATGEAISRA